MKSVNFSNLIGVPYSEANCWRITQLFYKQVLGIELKNYFETMPEDLSDRKNLVFTNVGDFQNTTTPKFGDLILLKIQGYESHIAIYLGSGKIFHTTEKNGSVIDKISRWEKMIVGYYTLGETK